MAGERLADFGLPDPIPVTASRSRRRSSPSTSSESDPLLGPEMRSTGEAMGIDDSFGMAFAKAQISAGMELPLEGTVVITVNDHDKPTVTPIARRLHDMGFRILATDGTARYLRARGVPCDDVFKVNEGRPNMADHLISGEVALLINTPLGKQSQYDDYATRRAAIAYKVPYITTMSAASAAADAISALRNRRREVLSVQEQERAPGAVVSGASWDAARAAAGSVLSGIDVVLAGEARNAFCSARPPGAMAMRDRSLGFALFNNVAVGALDLLRRRGTARVLVVEIADRAGLGIAEILGPERGVRLLSVHREDERARDWAGALVAAPVRAGAGAEEVGDALRLGLARALDGHAPEIVLLSLGLDALAGDPLGGLALRPDDLHPLTSGLRDLAGDLCHGRLVSVLDAGYHPQASAQAVVQHLRALAGLEPA
jgi:acetoin utilization deacetylase AcuC-like enzyme